ncbi:WxcM-like domain-containing protein [Candidatus Parcubacteria bacterium]|nr:MAG: WxcM-like domain-containing protein [Candidatus Parcubacteria bacterium]
MTKSICSTIQLPAYGGNDGTLVALEEMSDIVPFELRRVYYIYGVKGTLRRGFHAHKKLKQLLVCVSGECDVLLDDGTDRDVIRLGLPNLGILIDRPIWREIFNFSNDCVLMVLASEHYDIDDYIWDYEEFKKFVRGKDV